MTQKKPRAKQIKLSHINKQQKEVDKLTAFVLDEETNLQIKYYEIFSEGRIDDVLNEAYEKSTYAIKNDIEEFQRDDFFLKYIHFLIIKHFTSLKNEIPEDLESQVHIMEQIYNIGLFERLFDEILPPQEVEKVIGRLESFLINLSNIGQFQADEIERLNNLLQNKDVIHPLVSPNSGSNG